MILVTGASGFLGRHLVRYLSDQREQVCALYHNHPPVPELASLPGITWKKYDLLDVYDVEEAMAGITHIYHCAAIVSYDPGRREEMIHFNTESTTNLVNQALLQGVSKMVHISSIAAIGRSGDNNKEMTEEEEWGESRYNSAYGISKYLAETEVWRGIGEGLTAVIVNPGIILGVCEKRDPPARLLKLADNGFPFYTNGVTSWVDVSDVVNAIVHLMQSEIEAERFILSSGNYSFREIIASMASALDKRPPHLFAGKILSGLAWRWSVLKSNFSGKPAFLTRETALNANLLSLYSNKKLYDFLPAFTYTPLNTSIEQMAMHFRNSDKN